MLWYLFDEVIHNFDSNMFGIASCNLKIDNADMLWYLSEQVHHNFDSSMSMTATEMWYWFMIDTLYDFYVAYAKCTVFSDGLDTSTS